MLDTLHSALMNGVAALKWLLRGREQDARESLCRAFDRIDLPVPDESLWDQIPVLAETVGRSRDLAGDRGVALVAGTEGLPATVEIDAALVRQALANLVDNAVKYTPAGGRVDVTAELRETDGARKLAIIVADTGPGIPREHRGRIFERFYRVDTARSRSLGGTGLGLAIVKHAAALHGGGVELESGSSGSTFRLILPLPPSAPTA